MTKQIRQLATVITAHTMSYGDGVKLKRCLSPQQKNLFDPFILLDEFASDDSADYIGGFPEHPHRGFETATYMLEGAMLHRDHLGNEGELNACEAGKALKAGQLGRLIDGNELYVQTQNHPARFLLLAAMPLKEPVVQSGPFVMNSQEEIEQAFRDYRDSVLTL